MQQQKFNRLINETSPYLLEHAGNPVDWYPWGNEALARARAEDRPILLSIGYSACHWCHVMARESFENEHIAGLMNSNFINIKVDREERPDIDTVYMEAVQAITGSGGWPLTVFLTPEGKPFYGGTYFPPEERHGMPGFPYVLNAVSEVYRNRRREVQQMTGQITAALQSRGVGNATSISLTAEIIRQAFSALTLDFDSVYGGFGTAPKFPQPMVLELLLRYHLSSKDEKALEMVDLTLQKMAGGGIYDQIGGGFHRYATDSRWRVPHFEKMLYDNALLSRLYLHACLVTRNPLYRRISEEIIDYVLREMASPEGGFYSTQDADSEGEEGKHYLWTLDEIEKATGHEAAVSITGYYGATVNGNFEGRNILYVDGRLPAEEPGIARQAKAALLKEREKRVKPARDEKILASWNGLMLASLAEAACVFNRDDYLQAAIKNGEFLLGTMISEGYLLHSCKEGKAGIHGYLDDYAMVIEGLLNLHQATFSGRWLKEAVRLTDIMAEEFWDESEGIFYDTGKRHPDLFIRPRNIHDSAVPCGSSSATLVLIKISRLTGIQGLVEKAARSLGMVADSMSSYPLAYSNWLCALNLHLSAPREIAVIGSRGHLLTADLVKVIFENWLPNVSVAAADPEDPEAFTDIVLLENRAMVDGRPTVYLCEGYSCLNPVNDPDVLRTYLSKK